MLSKNKIKLVTSLQKKKFRDETGLFVAEGIKIVADLIGKLKCESVIISDNVEFDITSDSVGEIIKVTEIELGKISSMTTPQGVLGVFKKPNIDWEINQLKNELVLALDDIQDPGNLGTIIRIADWFGINNVFCSLHTADVYSPKTIQSTMGAIAKVNVHYVDLASLLYTLKNRLPIYGTCMDGKSLYSNDLKQNGIIVMGNEGNGISSQIQELLDYKLLIPDYPRGCASSESLNVGTATAIICAEFRRRLV
jgi:RNA methyltransferase, TrmH family